MLLLATLVSRPGGFSTLYKAPAMPFPSSLAASCLSCAATSLSKASAVLAAVAMCACTMAAGSGAASCAAIASFTGRWTSLLTRRPVWFAFAVPCFQHRPHLAGGFRSAAGFFFFLVLGVLLRLRCHFGRFARRSTLALLVLTLCLVLSFALSFLSLFLYSIFREELYGSSQ